jgi:hypothetical protein
MQSISTLEVKIRDHIIQVTQFKYLGFIVQNDVEIKSNVNNRIQVRWLKWRRVSCVLCDTNVPFKLKCKYIRRLSYHQCFMEHSVGHLRTNMIIKYLCGDGDVALDVW